MKKLLVTMAVAITGVVQAFALTPLEIRENARFLTDRMAYELNLTPQQIEDCYEINYDFICSINPIMDEVVYGRPEYIDRYYNYLDYRNDDLRYIMTEAQYLAFSALDYFFRPVYTYAGNWLFRVFQYYTNTRFFYYDPPLIYHTYFGGHGRHYFPHGYYGGGRYHHHIYAHYRPIHRGGGRHDFGPGAHRPSHHPATRPHHSHAMPGGGNNRHYRNNGGGNRPNGGGTGRPNGGGNSRPNDGINHRGGGNSHGNGMNPGGGNGRPNGDMNRGGSNNRASHARPQDSGRQMRQQSSGRSERMQGTTQRAASSTTRAASAPRSSSGSHSRGGGGSHHSGGSSHGSGHGGGSHGGGSHRR